MEMPSPKDSSLYSNVQVAASEEMMQFLKDFFPYISHFLRFFVAVYSNLLRRISLLTAASPCCPQPFRPSIYPCIYVLVQLEGVQKIIAPVNSPRESPYDESKLSCDGISTDTFLAENAMKVEWDVKTRCILHLVTRYQKSMYMLELLIQGCFRLISYPGMM